jgi:intracellular sulfur oxidation DsrE/DsrF family protein
MKLKLLFVVIGILISTGTAVADDNTVSKKGGDCSTALQSKIDSEFGAGTGKNTTCIAKRDDIRVVLNMSAPDLNPRNGFSQTLNNADAMLATYKAAYGINLGKGLMLDVVAYAQGGQFLLTDAAYNKLKSTPTAPYTAGNPSRAIVEKLLNAGVPIYMCQNTMRAFGWKTADVVPGVEQVPGGIVALVDYALRGWAVLTP